MKKEQIEALRLADALDAWDGTLMMPAGWRQRTSAELRRLAAIKAQRDALKQTLHDELEGNLRLRDLGGARPDEPMLTFLERIIAERDALLKALKRMATIIDKMGDMPDGFIHPSPWQELKCEEALTQALAAIKMVEGGE